MPSIIAMQQILAKKALYQPNHRFNDLYGLVRDPIWLRVALESILLNDGAKTAGTDGITEEHLRGEEARAQLAKGIAQQLKDGSYRPTPVRRVYIPKQNGKLRPLGIPTIADRMVQETLRMVLEPIWESYFQPCSYGFRPERSTMDAMRQLQVLTNKSHRYYWVVEGDIKGCFDNIPHEKLLHVLAEKVADQRLLTLIRRMLAAGYEEGGRVHTPNCGTPQGGVVSPLLANIYLHKMDEAWRARYSIGDQNARHKVRKNGRGLVQLIRYADDFLVLTNGERAQAEALKEEFRQILDGLGLELSTDKTLITHVNDGFDFLGFHCQRKPVPHRGGGYALYIEPTEKNCQRLRDRIREILATTNEDVVNKIRAVNMVLRGWANYYRHVQSSRARHQLDHWVWWAILGWLNRKHGRKLGRRELYDLYIRRDRKGWRNWTSQGISVLIMSRDIGYTMYMREPAQHPYLNQATSLLIRDEEPLSADSWRGTSSQNRYAIARLQRAKEVGYKCEACGGTFPLAELDAHHPRGKESKDTIHEIQILCRECHKKTPSYGSRDAFERTGEPDAVKVASPVRRRVRNDQKAKA